MLEQPEPIPTIRWSAEERIVRILDQRRLPRRETYLEIRTPRQMIAAIRSLAVRGAPALGIAGAYGVALAAHRALDAGADPRHAVSRAAERLSMARPTAVNLRLGVEMATRLAASGSLEHLERAGDKLLEEDLAASRSMAEHGLPLIPQGRRVLTHCNTGGLATGGLGTALAVIRLAVARGRTPEVLLDETRPLLQGSRLTLWELLRDGIPARVIPDGAAAWAIRRMDVGCVMVGADRIARNGDSANKIGTYGLALAAAAHGIPFYIVAPTTTLDPEVADGDAIPIEERPSEEVLRAAGWSRTDRGRAFNPAFDVTPARLITGWVTEKGVIFPPFGGRIAGNALES